MPNEPSTIFFPKTSKTSKISKISKTAANQRESTLLSYQSSISHRRNPASTKFNRITLPVLMTSGQQYNTRDLIAPVDDYTGQPSPGVYDLVSYRSKLASGQSSQRALVSQSGEHAEILDRSIQSRNSLLSKVREKRRNLEIYQSQIVDVKPSTLHIRSQRSNHQNYSS